MGKTIRFGISLDSELLDKFDALCEEKCYQTRSEAIRDLIRNTLVEEEWKDLNKEMVGTLTLVYDHHQSDLAQKITEIQH
jgi:CopG family nickel-responsive transcriptional regulator